MSETDKLPSGSLEDETRWSIIQAYFHKRLTRPEYYSVPPANLYHYTTVDGVFGILKSTFLFASAAYYLNDSSEIDYGRIVFGSVLSRWTVGNKELIIDPMIRAFIDELRSLNDAESLDAKSVKNMFVQIYVTCFCEEENLLSQWRAYGQSGGYAIGFRGIDLHTQFSASGDWYELRLARVIYERSEQEMLLENLVRDAVAALLESKSNHEQDVGFLFGRAVYLTGLTEIARLKHPAFKEEREWRLIVRPMIGPHFLVGRNEMKFRPSRGLLTPYLELRPKSSLLPIESVRYGPTLDKRRAESSLSFLLAQRGYKDVQLHGSDIPVRL